MGQLEKIWSDTAAEVHKIVVGPMDNNVYILRCRRTGDAMLIDAANEHEALLEICQQLGVRSVVETHGHWDHIQAVPAVRDAGYSVAVTSADAGDAAELRPDLGRRRDTRRSATCASRPWPPPATPRAPSASPSRAPTCSSPATRSSPAGPGNTSFEGGDFPTIIESIDRRIFAGFSPTPWSCPAMATPPPWARVPPPARMGRPGLVRTAGTGAAEPGRRPARYLF